MAELYTSVVVFLLDVSVPFFNCSNGSTAASSPTASAPKRAMTIRSWQCGYKELVDYVKKNYDKFDKFYISDRHGQPYIFFLYYWPFEPADYQKQAKISAPDEYGFGQVGKFDKFEFKFDYKPEFRKTVSIGYPESFNDFKPEVLSKIKKIIVGGEEIFLIYEAN